MAYNTVMLEEKETGVFWLTLNRPDRLNAFSAEMYQEMGSAIEEIEKSPGFRALVITGAGRAFCAGADISELLRRRRQLRERRKGSNWRTG